MQISKNDQGLDEKDIKIPGVFKRNAPLLFIILFTLLISPILTRFIDTYRGIILEKKEDSVFVGYEKKPPHLIKNIHLNEGDIIVKKTWKWNFYVDKLTEKDEILQKIYKRYTRSYTGKIVHINSPLSHKAPSVAVIKLDNSEKLESIEIWAKHLEKATVGKKVKKNPYFWDPILVD